MFELTIEDDKVTSKKILSLEKPTALTFDKDGHLYVTDGASDIDSKPAGRVIRVDGDL